MGNGMVAILRHQHRQARQKVSLGGAWGPAATYPQTYINQSPYSIVSSDRSSCTDDGLLYIYIYIYPQHQLFQIFTQSLDAIDVTSVTLKRLNSINADDVTRYFGDILGIF